MRKSIMDFIESEALEDAENHMQIVKLSKLISLIHVNKWKVKTEKWELGWFVMKIIHPHFNNDFYTFMMTDSQVAQISRQLKILELNQN